MEGMEMSKVDIQKEQVESLARQMVIDGKTVYLTEEGKRWISRIYTNGKVS